MEGIRISGNDRVWRRGGRGGSHPDQRQRPRVEARRAGWKAFGSVATTACGGEEGGVEGIRIVISGRSRAVGANVWALNRNRSLTAPVHWRGPPEPVVERYRPSTAARQHQGIGERHARCQF